MAFLRYLDLFWVAPAVEDMKFLHIESCACLRNFPKTKEEEEEENEFVQYRVKLN
jgi:hypothetical protein